MTNPDTKTRLPIAAQTKYCVAIGNFRDGFSIYGPYDTLSEAKVLVDGRRREYNHIRPHSSLGYKLPAPEAVLHIEGNTSLLFGSAPLHPSTTATQNSVS